MKKEMNTIKFNDGREIPFAALKMLKVEKLQEMVVDVDWSNEASGTLFNEVMKIAYESEEKAAKAKAQRELELAKAQSSAPKKENEEAVKKMNKVKTQKEAYFYLFEENFKKVIKAGNVIYIDGQPYFSKSQLMELFVSKNIATSNDTVVLDMIRDYAETVEIKNLGFSFNNVNFNKQLSKTDVKQYFQLAQEYKEVRLEDISEDLQLVLGGYTNIEDIIKCLSRAFFNDKILGDRAKIINFFSPKASIGKSALVELLMNSMPAHFTSRITDPATQLFGRFSKASLNLKIVNYIDDLEFVFPIEAKGLITSDNLEVEIKNESENRLILNSGTFITTSNQKVIWANLDNATQDRTLDIKVETNGNKIESSIYSTLVDKREVQEEFINLLFTTALEMKLDKYNSYWKRFQDSSFEDNKIVEFLKDLTTIEMYDDYINTNSNLFEVLINSGVDFNELHQVKRFMALGDKRQTLWNVYSLMTKTDKFAYKTKRRFLNELDKLEIVMKRSQRSGKNVYKMIISQEIIDEINKED